MCSRNVHPARETAGVLFYMKPATFRRISALANCSRALAGRDGSAAAGTDKGEAHMVNRAKTTGLAVLLVMFMVAGCSWKKQAGTSGSMNNRGGVVRIEAGSYSFSPRSIQVEKPGMLALEIANTTGSTHNFTLRDPAGKIIKSVDIRGRASIISNIDLPQSGTYEFYCNKTFHARMGAKGKIVVGISK